MLPLSFSEYFCFKQGDKSEAYDDYFLKKIIDNPVYMGKIAYRRRRTEKKTGTRNEMHVVEKECMATLQKQVGKIRKPDITTIARIQEMPQDINVLFDVTLKSLKLMMCLQN